MKEECICNSYSLRLNPRCPHCNPTTYPTQPDGDVEIVANDPRPYYDAAHVTVRGDLVRFEHGLQSLTIDKLREEVDRLRSDLEIYAEALSGASIVIDTLQARLARWQSRADELTRAALAAQVIDGAAIEITNGGNVNVLQVLTAVAEWLEAYQAPLACFRQMRQAHEEPDEEEVAAAVEALTEAGWQVTDLGGSFVTFRSGKMDSMMDVGVSPRNLVRRAKGVL